MMRVLMLDPSSYTPYYDHSLCQALGAAGCNVELVTAPFIYDDLPAPELYRRRYGFARLLALGSKSWLRSQAPLRRLAKALEYPLDWLVLWRQYLSHPPDLIHLQWSVDPPMDAWWLSRLCRRGLPVVYTAHNVTPHPGEPTRRAGLKDLYQLASQVIVHSQANRKELLATFDVPVDRVHVLPVGNLDDFRGPAIDKLEARRRLGIPTEAPVALFFGLIKPYKGLDVLLRAFALTKPRLPKAQLLVAGQPNMFFEGFQALIDDLGIRDAVLLDLRFVPHTEMRVHFTAADVVVLPYIETSQSAVLLTAYTFGRPVITTRTGGLPEVVEEGRSGLLVPPGDDKALAEAMIALLSHPERLAEMGAYARHLTETKHSWSSIARATLEVYRSSV